MLQFVTTLTNNIEALSGSPVQVTINSISPGSIKVASTVAFLNGDAGSASTYQTALTSGDPAKVFGTSFGDVAVDTSSIKAVTVSNPSKPGPILCMIPNESTCSLCRFSATGLCHHLISANFSLQNACFACQAVPDFVSLSLGGEMAVWCLLSDIMLIPCQKNVADTSYLLRLSVPVMPL